MCMCGLFKARSQDQGHLHGKALLQEASSVHKGFLSLLQELHQHWLMHYPIPFLLSSLVLTKDLLLGDPQVLQLSSSLLSLRWGHLHHFNHPPLEALRKQMVPGLQFLIQILPLWDSHQKHPAQEALLSQMFHQCHQHLEGQFPHPQPPALLVLDFQSLLRTLLVLHL